MSSSHLHVQGDAPDRLQRLVQARDHLVDADPLAERLQRDEHTAVTSVTVSAAGSDIQAFTAATAGSRMTTASTARMRSFIPCGAMFSAPSATP